MMFVRPTSLAALVTRCLLAGLCLSLMGWLLFIYPIAHWLLGGLLLVYAGMLWRWPGLFLVVLPAIVPSLDLGLWTGWTAVCGPDMFILLTIAVLLVRAPPTKEDIIPSGWPLWVLLLLIVSGVVGVVLGLLSPLGYTGHSDNPYLRPDNALRLFKGTMEALALLPFLRQRHRVAGGVPMHLGWGLAIGLALVTLEVITERALFVGLLDFKADYRVVGPFTSMRIGGGHIGAYVAMVLPFVLTLGMVRGRGRWLTWPLVLLVALGGSYTLVVAFARTAYIATLGASVIVGFCLLLASRRQRRVALAIALIPFLVVSAALGLAASSELMRQRFSTLAEDLRTREANWAEGWSVRDSNLRSILIGMGLGTYQRAMLSRALVNRPSDLTVEADDDGYFVSVTSLTPLYLGQKFIPPANGELRLTLQFRSDKLATTLGYVLCDKVLLYSDHCRGGQAVPAHPGSWETLSVNLSTNGLGAAALMGLVHRPVELALFAPVGSTAAFRDVRLVDTAGHNLLTNGNFSHGLDRWLFTDDDHASWRIENQYLMVLFESGLLGLLTLASVCGLALAGGVRAALAGRVMGAVVAGSIASFLISGIADHVLEVSKITTLFLLICWAGLLQWETERSNRSAP